MRFLSLRTQEHQRAGSQGGAPSRPEPAELESENRPSQAEPSALRSKGTDEAVAAGDHTEQGVAPGLGLPRWARRAVIFVGTTAATALIGAVVGLVVPRWSESLSGPPLRFSTISNAVLDGGESWVLPRPLSAEDERSLDLANPQFLDGLDRFRERIAADYDGVRLGAHFLEEKQFSPLQVTVEGQRDDPVVIRDMRARVTSRQPPLDGTLIYGMPQGVNPVVQIAFDLDDPGPVARAMDESGRLGGPYFANHYVTVGKGDPTVFTIQAFTATCYCEWVIDVYAVVDGRQETYTVQDGTRPFRATAWAPSYQAAYSFNFDAGRFERTDACRSGPTESCFDAEF